VAFQSYRVSAVTGRSQWNVPSPAPSTASANRSRLWTSSASARRRAVTSSAAAISDVTRPPSSRSADAVNRAHTTDPSGRTYRLSYANRSPSPCPTDAIDTASRDASSGGV
jgi:hypothetical protein